MSMIVASDGAGRVKLGIPYHEIQVIKQAANGGTAIETLSGGYYLSEMQFDDAIQLFQDCRGVERRKPVEEEAQCQ